MVWASFWLGVKVSRCLQTLMLGQVRAVIPVLMPLALNLLLFVLYWHFAKHEACFPCRQEFAGKPEDSLKSVLV